MLFYNVARLEDEQPEILAVFGAEFKLAHVVASGLAAALAADGHPCRLVLNHI